MSDQIDFSTAGRMCYYIPADGLVKGRGYRVSIVFENLSGHYPTGGDGKEPWYWGNDYKAAVQCAHEQNKRLGLSKEDVDMIVMHSMGQQNRETTARKEANWKQRRSKSTE